MKSLLEGAEQKKKKEERIKVNKVKGIKINEEEESGPEETES